MIKNIIVGISIFMFFFKSSAIANYDKIFHDLNIESIFLLFMLPGIDMFRLFLKRIYQGRNPFRGDKDHLHHLLLNNLGNIKSLLIYNLLILYIN